MASELDPVMVLADRLQAEGDPRGELLALELAAALAPTVEESRRACREASAIRATIPELAWPRALWGSRGQIRAGLLVVGTWSPTRAPELPSSLGPWTRELLVVLDDRHLGLPLLHAATSEVGLRLDGLWQADSAAPRWPPCTLDLQPAQTFDLPALGLIQPLGNPPALRQLRGLVDLRLERIEHWWSWLLARELPALALRSLSVPLDAPAQLAEVLDACPNLERLAMPYPNARLEPHPGLERLRSLAIRGSRDRVTHGPKLADTLVLPRLESLTLTGAAPSDVEQLVALGLRSLDLFGPVGDPDVMLEAIAKLDALEHLGLHWREVDHGVGPLERLAKLRSLELAGRANGELRLHDHLERLVLHELPGSLRVRGSPAELHARFPPGFELDVQLERTRTLGLTTEYGPLQLVEQPERRLPSVETIVVEQLEDRDRIVAWLRALPSLRTVFCPNQTIRQQQALSELLPDIQILGGHAAWLRNDIPISTRFDPLDPSTWPKSD